MSLFTAKAELFFLAFSQIKIISSEIIILMFCSAIIGQQEREASANVFLWS